jgi:hypothetical protein
MKSTLAIVLSLAAFLRECCYGPGERHCCHLLFLFIRSAVTGLGNMHRKLSRFPKPKSNAPHRPRIHIPASHHPKYLRMFII